MSDDSKPVTETTAEDIPCILCLDPNECRKTGCVMNRRREQITTHALRRTSPKGKGVPFIGTCLRCGMRGLSSGAALERCENVAGLSDDEALLEALK